MGKRHNIDTIAELLIDKLDSMEQVAEKIENVSKKPLKIDLEGVKTLLQEQRKVISEQNTAEKNILKKIENLQQKNKTRLPNWVLGVLFAFFIGLIGSIFFAYSSIKKVDLLERENEYYKAKYLEVKKDGK